VKAISLCLALLLSSPALACGPDALGVSRTIEIGGAATSVGLKTYPRTIALADKELILTFDDGPNAPTTDRILAALDAECVKATFFLIGRNAQAAPDVVRREIAAGHTVGHHSFSHPAVTLRNLGEDAARADIDKGIAADDKAAYGAAGAGPKVPFFRFPGFADTAALDEWLIRRGITIFGADLWASDWQPMTPDEELSLLLGRIEKARKGIVLMHDTIGATAQMLPNLLRELKKRGYRIVHIVPGKGPTPIEPAPKGWSSETEKTLAHMWPKAPPVATTPTLRPALKPVGE
jgi:peptidoglycan-N-acetylglucosamine deacetylase